MIRLLKWLTRLLFKICYRVDVRGMENLKGIESVIITPNHVSLLDGLLIELFIPAKKTFFVDTVVAEKPLNKFLLSFVDYRKINLNNPFALKHMLKTLKLGGNCVIFPEGRITVTGLLMKIQHGTGIIAEKGNYSLLPVWIRGAEKTPFSYSRQAHIPQTFPKISIYIGEKYNIHVDPLIRGKKRRELLALRVNDAMREVCRLAHMNRKDLFENLADAGRRFGMKRAVLQDHSYTQLNYQQIITASLVLGKKLRDKLPGTNRIGLLIPNSNGVAVTFFALQAYGFTPAMINFSSGRDSIRATVIAAGLKQVLTSYKVIEAGKLEDIVEALSDIVTFIYLEDIRAEISFADKLKGKLASYNPSAARIRYRKSQEDEAVIMFTSGSEGVPKGVVLSCCNILSNLSQITAHIGLTPSDVNFNCLPVFHSFGLTVGTIYPLLNGIKVFMYPSPLHYSIIPQVIYDCNATILVGTDTFFMGYARKASPYDFFKIRMAVAGAEKVKEHTQKMFIEKFGIRILEGYGATEASPVLSCNTLMYNKPGTVGRLLPGIRYRLSPVPGFENGGELTVRGPNIMKGYLKYDKPGVLEPAGEWYNTGDIVQTDDYEFVSIVGRTKRFVKIGGEMVSLGAVENIATDLEPGFMHAALPFTSEKKGQEIYLVTECESLDRKRIVDYIGDTNKSPLLAPRKVIFIEKIPLLATGKINYPDLTKIITE